MMTTFPSRHLNPPARSSRQSLRKPGSGHSVRRRLRDSGYRRRGGFTLMEVLVAAAVIGSLFLVTIPLLSRIRAVRQEAERRMLAGQETANLMEAVAALAQQGELTREALDGLMLSSAAERLPDAAVDVEMAPAEAPFFGRQITVTVTWTSDAGPPAVATSLTAWFPEAGGE